ncbi:MAG: efflux RND transporter periplasmic adaptor subunit [Methylacidiphilales bacterium]|nr:efflux RND transporter periplasmic adaptor subunit [Candidatus Methylacidiphilales bacterium]
MKSTATADTAHAAPAPAAANSVDVSNGMVNIAPERLQEIGVTTEVVAKRVLTRLLRAPARAEIDESALRDINIKAGAGYIEKLYANYEGMTVRKGEPLMRVLSEDWVQTQIDYIKSYRAWKRTPLMSQMNTSTPLNNQLELMRARIRVWDLSEDQIHDLEKFAIGTNEIDLRTGHGLSGSFDVLAPFDGYVRTKKAVEGMRFEAGQSLLELADHSHVWIAAEFPEDQAPYVNVGQKMTVTFPSMPGEKIDGAISFLDPHVDEDQRRIRARIVVADPDHKFHPGLFAEVSGETPLGQRLSISTGAVVPTGDTYIVFIDHGGGKLEPREIEIGVHSGDYDEVISGLNEGDRVISSANFLIDAESRIQGVLKTWGTRQ